jgi:hypothetical protein
MGQARRYMGPGILTKVSTLTSDHRSRCEE